MTDVVIGQTTTALESWLANNPLTTPFLVIDVDKVVDQYDRLAAAAPDWDIYYAVKALPEARIVEALAARGCRFDVASRAEIELCMSVGITGAHISYGNTAKKRADIAHAVASGVPLYAFDSVDELDKLTLAATQRRGRTRAPLQVMCRVLVDTDGSDWPLNAKFGCEPEMAVDLLLEAHRRGLSPWGVAFHVGSQQREPGQWRAALRTVAAVYAAVAAAGVELPGINIGGGLPAQYLQPVPAIEEYVEIITDALTATFGPDHPRVLVEPGRHLVADAGVLRTEVITVARKHTGSDVRWVTIDTGRYGALAETADEAIKYRLRTSRDGGATGPVILAGPTCDSADILYQRYQYQLPLELRSGDTLDVLSAGAYTSCYAAAWFNGLVPPPVYFTQDGDVLP